MLPIFTDRMRCLLMGKMGSFAIKTEFIPQKYLGSKGIRSQGFSIISMAENISALLLFSKYVLGIASSRSSLSVHYSLQLWDGL